MQAFWNNQFEMNDLEMPPPRPRGMLPLSGCFDPRCALRMTTYTYNITYMLHAYALDSRPFPPLPVLSMP